MVTSIDVEISGRAGRQPAALVTSMIVSFTLRTSTRPSTIVSFSRRPLVTSTGVSFTPRPLDQAEPGVSRRRGPGDEHGR